MAKEIEYQAFLKMIEDEAQFAHWAEIGRVLGINKNTLMAWKKRPEAQAAIAKGINRALKEMETVGKKDWRMWAEKLKLLGMNPVNEVKHDFADPIAEILKKYGLNTDVGKTQDSPGDPPPSTT